MNRQTSMAHVGQAQAQSAPAPLAIASGTLEALKWFALILMTIDHINKYVLTPSLPALYSLGRIAMPLFVFVLAYNLARPGTLANSAHWRTAKRLALFGIVACVPFIALGKVLGGWWPLNIMFTLAVATIVIGLVEHGGRWHTTLAVVIFIVGGGLVEYWWFALALTIVCWLYCKRPSMQRTIALGGAFLALWVANQNPWGLAALPLLMLAPHIHLNLPRCPRFFYFYYPVHLALVYLLARSLN